ncbi:hypothetical protein CR513_21899, partial [Mucuna pruriens]
MWNAIGLSSGLRHSRPGPLVVGRELVHLRCAFYDSSSNLIPIRDEFPNEQLLQLNKIKPWFVDIFNYIVASKFPPKASRLYKEKVESDAKYYIWDDPYLWRLYSDQVIRRCILDFKIKSVLHFYHSTYGGGHYGSTQTARKFGVPKALINDQGNHFCNRVMSYLLDKYDIVHRIAITYHPKTNGQAEENQENLAKDGESQPERLEPTPRGHSMGTQNCISDSVRDVSLSDRYRQSSNAIWPMTKPTRKGSFNCKNWRNFAWKRMRTPRSSSRRPILGAFQSKKKHLDSGGTVSARLVPS